ncbi:OLC1v1026875C1 [Oldenlandia corymbosa var. corymbosa]|nr:OLC1v1026875C1 [Oldenlandia corymbosa var. corymbosa]
MAIVEVPGLFKERKYPFIASVVFVISLFAAFLLFSSSQSSAFRSYAGVNVITQSPPQQENAGSLKNSTTSPSGDDAPETTFTWKLCEGPGMIDFIPCLDNWKAMKAYRKLERKERHCPTEPSSRCLIPLPPGYKMPIPWPKSRDMIWYDNVPHPKLVEYKKDQHWVVKSGEYLIFPGGGTQFKEGVGHYIEAIEKILPVIEWGKHTRVVLDVGCGVASFGGYLLDRDVITLSFAPKDEHDAQIQFALERGIPATLAVISTKKLTFPDNAYDMIHCARCRIRWDADGGKPLIEINRILRPGGYFVWSATPVYVKDEEHQNIWKATVALTESMCWKIVNKTSVHGTSVGVAIFQKPTTPSCYKSRQEDNPPLCDSSKHVHISWDDPLDGCLPPIPAVSTEDHSNWPLAWPERLKTKSSSLSSVEPGSATSYEEDSNHWSALVSDVYLKSLAINWSSIRNVMDMNAGYGGFAAALIDLPVWVMNVVPVNEPDTLSVVFDRGLIGTYHDWCESLSTYPRTYDLLHASFLFKKQSQR